MTVEDRIVTLELEAWALVLQGLAELAFKDVFELIGRINRLAHLASGPEHLSLELSIRELGLCFRGLGELPYARVHGLVSRLHRFKDDRPDQGHP